MRPRYLRILTPGPGSGENVGVLEWGNSVFIPKTQVPVSGRAPVCGGAWWKTFCFLAWRKMPPVSPTASSGTRALRREQVKEKALHGACLFLSPGRALLFPTSWYRGDRSAWAPLRRLEAFAWRQGRSLLCPPSSVLPALSVSVTWTHRQGVQFCLAARAWRAEPPSHTHTVTLAAGPLVPAGPPATGAQPFGC